MAAVYIYKRGRYWEVLRCRRHVGALRKRSEAFGRFDNVIIDIIREYDDMADAKVRKCRTGIRERLATGEHTF